MQTSLINTYSRSPTFFAVCLTLLNDIYPVDITSQMSSSTTNSVPLFAFEFIALLTSDYIFFNDSHSGLNL